jgi:hypothetical protein
MFYRKAQLQKKNNESTIIEIHYFLNVLPGSIVYFNQYDFRSDFL